MKLYEKILYASLLIGVSTSCNKQLDLPSDGRISMNEVFSDYNRTRGYLNSCYGYAPMPDVTRSSFTDEAQDADDVIDGSKYTMWYGGNITTTSFASYSPDGSPWSRLYEGVRKCNVFLSEIKTASVYASEEEKSGWIAQAHTLRALYYLQLIKRYGSVPIFEEPLAIDHDFSQDHKSSFSEVVAFIMNDCDEALKVDDTREGFSWAIYENQFGKMTRAIAYAIKSQAVTYAASSLWTDGTYSWADATTITAEALAACLANDYKLFDVKPAEGIAQNAYALYFITSSNDQRSVDKETIYQLGGQMLMWKNAGLPTNPGMERAGPNPSQELIDSYEMANGEPAILGYADADHLQPEINTTSGYDPNNPYEGRDPRFYASIYFNGADRDLAGKQVETFVGGNEGISSTDRRFTRTGYYLRKFNNHRSGSSNNSDGAVRLFRLGELYLNFAEAAYQSVGPDVVVEEANLGLSARQAVNTIRARAEMPAIQKGLTKDAFEKRYRNERRVELAFEEHRYFDVRRWEILDQTDKFITGMRIQRNGTNLTYTRFKFRDRGSSDEKFLLYPVDQTEVNKIFELTGENWQNPGWLD
ncbi:RagB/SusD family nutrient uptake outer membrane protein [Sphingobacterium sp. JB170]|uniref:RagB/SusD family nutrient uptake outer membrane protein n=1 Tax=Sphingobacterium sp. JB170 TaxID=1434842 RepID=UPI00097ECE19|nr:RagB/SusD family nutrient uptake outer membrane protein [Sphingobacterium sp. JB170]SJN37428.1 putative outer membrane protein, probably involved in nutrient binding [Sphingobacterium sp. JB170]